MTDEFSAFGSVSNQENPDGMWEGQMEFLEWNKTEKYIL